MDGPGDYHTYMRNLEKMIQMNLFTNRNRLTDREQTYGSQGGRDRLGVWD